MRNLFNWTSIKTFAFPSIISGILCFSSCKENTILPPDLVPPVDNINTFIDTTLKVVTHNVYQDSILTGGLGPSDRISSATTYYHALGTFANDPLFGKTVAGIHTEIVPPNTNFQFKGTAQMFDSVVLSIPYKTSFGDTINAVPQTFNVYRSLKSFSRDSAQYEFTKDSINFGEVMSSKTINFNTFRTDSPLVGTVKVIPQLRFPLASWFIDSLNAQVKLNSTGAVTTYANFLNWWKGFYITPADSNVGNTLGYFNTYGTRMYIYYRDSTTSGKVDTTIDIFGFDANSTNRFNHITRNYTGSLSANYINTTSVEGDSLIFLQSAPGLSAVLSFPDLGTVQNNVINKAELLFNSFLPTSQMTDTLKGGLIPRLYVFKMDQYGVDKVVTDYANIGSGFVDGKRYDASFFGMTFVQYKFTLTETFQKAISEKDTTFRLKILGTNIGLPGYFQSQLRGGSSLVAAMKPRLNLIYTKIK